MRLWPHLSSEKIHPLNELERATQGHPFYVPNGQSALVVRNGVPEQFLRPGNNPLPPGKVEVRLLDLNPMALPGMAPPSREALTIPFERSFLHVDGELLGVLKQESAHPSATPTPIRAWESPAGDRGTRGRKENESISACLYESLRACHPESKICCGARMGPSAIRHAS